MVKRELHPIATVLLGAAFGALLGLLGIWLTAAGPQPVDAKTAAWVCLCLAGGFALLFGLAHACYWVCYWICHRFPSIQEGARAGFGLGTVLGVCLMLVSCGVACAGGNLPHHDLKAVPYLIGFVGGAAGFLIGMGIAIVRRGR